MKIISLVLSLLIIFFFNYLNHISCANSHNRKFKILKSQKKNEESEKINNSIKSKINFSNNNKHYVENDEMNSYYGKINVKKLKRDMSDYSGDNLHVLGYNTVYTPLVKLPPPIKNEIMDELPVIWQSGPLKGKVMTEEDFPKPFGYYYSEYKQIHPEH